MSEAGGDAKCEVLFSAWPGSGMQMYFFELDLKRGACGDAVEVRVTSSLGPGRGWSNREFRNATLRDRGDAGRFAPFDRYWVTQRYLYEEGRRSDLRSSDGAAVLLHRELAVEAPGSGAALLESLALAGGDPHERQVGGRRRRAERHPGRALSARSEHD